MKITLSVPEIANYLMIAGGDRFSYGAAMALAAWLDTVYDENTEFKPTDICAEFMEYESAECAVNDYFGHVPARYEPLLTTTEEACLEFLKDNTTVIQFDGGIIIQAF